MMRPRLRDVLGPPRRVLLYGIGNPGRQDDGLGLEVVEALAVMAESCGLETEANYQLSPEDALRFVEKDVVLLVDATLEATGLEPYTFDEVLPATEASFTSHVLSLGSLLTLCERLYRRRPRAYALGLAAYSFEVNEALSPGASASLAATVADLRVWLEAHHAPPPHLRQRSP